MNSLNLSRAGMQSVGVVPRCGKTMGDLNYREMPIGLEAGKSAQLGV